MSNEREVTGANPDYKRERERERERERAREGHRFHPTLFELLELDRRE